MIRWKVDNQNADNNISKSHNTENEMKNKPNQDTAYKNKVFWSHSTDRQ